MLRCKPSRIPLRNDTFDRKLLATTFGEQHNLELSMAVEQAHHLVWV